MPVAGGDTAICLRPTGAAGGLARLGEWTRRDSATELIAASPSGFGAPTAVRLGSLATCAAAAGPLVAGPVHTGRGRFEMRAAVAGSGPAVALGDASFLPAVPAVALAPGGHAVVAWAQHRGSVVGLDDIDVRIVSARRSPDGAFGPAEPLTRWRATDEFETTVLAGIDDAGTATVAWSQPLVERRNESNGIVAIAAATAAPGRPFAVQRVAPRAEEVSRPALAVAGDGGALLVHGDTVDGPVAFDRPPGAAAFARVTVGGESGAVWPAVALRRGGGAVIAWNGFGDEVYAVRRPARGPFGRVERVAGDDDSVGFGVAEAILIGGPLGSTRPFDTDNTLVRAALAADGRALLGWAGGDPARPRLAAGTLADGFGAPQALGSPVRDANGVVPLFLADGRAAVAWTDNVGFREFPARAGRLHLAVAGAPRAAEPPLPRLTVSGSRAPRLFAGQSLTVTARCDRACDVRAQSADTDAGRPGVSASRSSAGPLRLRVPVSWLPREQEDGRAGRLIVRATAPGGRRVARAVLRTRVILRRSLPVPRPIGLRARRAGRNVVVTWRTRRPARRVLFVVEGRRSRGADVVDDQAFAYVTGRGRTRFRAVLRSRAAPVRWVNVDAYSEDSAPPRRGRRVRVR